MSRRHGVGPEVARGLQKVGELHMLIATDAGDRRLAREIAFGERRDDLLAKAALVVEHVMRDPRASPRPRVHRGCRARRSRSPCGMRLPASRHHRAAALCRRHHSRRAPAWPPRPTNPRHPTSRRRPGLLRGSWRNRVSSGKVRDPSATVGAKLVAMTRALTPLPMLCQSCAVQRALGRSITNRSLLRGRTSRKFRASLWTRFVLRAAAAIVTLSKPKRLSNAAGWLSQVLSSEA